MIVANGIELYMKFKMFIYHVYILCADKTHLCVFIVYCILLGGHAISHPHLTLLSKETRHHFVFNSFF